MKALYLRLRERGYTRGELILAFDRLMDDIYLDEKIRYGGDLSGADFKRIIEPIRKARRQLLDGRLLTESEMWETIDTVPDLTREDFGVGSDEGDRRFRINPQGKEKLSREQDTQSDA